MGLGGEKPLGEGKTKAPNSDYHKSESPVVARHVTADHAMKPHGKTRRLIGKISGKTQWNRYNSSVLMGVIGCARSQDTSEVYKKCGN